MPTSVDSIHAPREIRDELFSQLVDSESGASLPLFDGLDLSHGSSFRRKARDIKSFVQQNRIPNSMYTTSVSLLQQLRERDANSAWGRFVELYSPLLFYWARRIGMQDQDAADLVQEVFTVLLARLPEFQYDRDQSFRAWLRTVAMNLWRTQARRKRVTVTGESELELDELSGDAIAADEAFWEREYQQHIVRQAMRVMEADFAPQTWRACWAMVAEGKTAPQVADELGMTVGAVYASKIRVLSRLKEELQGMLD